MRCTCIPSEIFLLIIIKLMMSKLYNSFSLDIYFIFHILVRLSLKFLNYILLWSLIFLFFILYQIDPTVLLLSVLKKLHGKLHLHLDKKIFIVRTDIPCTYGKSTLFVIINIIEMAENIILFKEVTKLIQNKKFKNLY